MQLLTRLALETLMEMSKDVCLSIFMPAERVGSEVQQNPIRLKNLLSEAEEKLISYGLRTSEVHKLLAPVKQMVPDTRFWQQQEQGLALFRSLNFFRIYRVPLELNEMIVVSNRFHITPLIPLVNDDRRFYILALSQNQVRLFQGRQSTISQIDLLDTPTSLAQVLQYDDPEQRLQFHTATGSPGTKSGRPAAFHGHSTTEDSKASLRRFIKQVDKGVSGLLSQEPASLVLAGVDYLLAMYREVSDYPHLLDKGITGNPDELSAKELHQAAWQIVHPVFLRSQQEAISHFHLLAGTKSRRAADDFELIIPAAYHGRVETLFAAADVKLWGAFDPWAETIRLEGNDEELIGFCVTHTILKGGTVYVVDEGKMPGDPPLSAVLRY